MIYEYSHLSKVREISVGDGRTRVPSGPFRNPSEAPPPLEDVGDRVSEWGDICLDPNFTLKPKKKKKRLVYFCGSPVLRSSFSGPSLRTTVWSKIPRGEARVVKTETPRLETLLVRRVKSVYS